MALIYGYVGTYTSPEAPGTYRFRLDTQSGALDAPELIYPQTNTKYAAWSQGRKERYFSRKMVGSARRKR